jgi:enoyl-[acyl-carrier protein] reductase III
LYYDVARVKDDQATTLCSSGRETTARKRPDDRSETTAMTVLITGGTKGIGLAIARRFAKPGVDIFMAYKRDDDSAAAASAEIGALGARPHAIRTDVGTPAGARELIAKVGAVVDQLDVVVHGAVKVLVGPILDADPEAFREAITLNGTSLVFLVQAARPLLKRGSSVIFLSSRGSRQIVPAYAAIGAGKALAEALARYLAPELAPLGVRINCVAPGTLDTEAVRNRRRNGRLSRQRSRRQSERTQHHPRRLHRAGRLPRWPGGVDDSGAGHLRQRRPVHHRLRQMRQYERGNALGHERTTDP